MSEQAAPSVAFIITRNGDPFTLALRNGYDLSNDDLLQLSQASSSASTSVGSSPTAVFSSREPSNVTKPTSYGTSYPAHDYNGEGKVDTMYAASLSATHGSESEAEVEYDDARCIALLGTGAWSSGTQTHGSCLRKLENAKIRSSKIRLSKALPHRLKKPSIVLHQDATSACQDEEQPPTAAPAQMGAGTYPYTYCAVFLVLLFDRSNVFPPPHTRSALRAARFGRSYTLDYLPEWSEDLLHRQGRHHVPQVQCHRNYVSRGIRDDRHHTCSGADSGGSFTPWPLSIDHWLHVLDDSWIASSNIFETLHCVSTASVPLFDTSLSSLVLRPSSHHRLLLLLCIWLREFFTEKNAFTFARYISDTTLHNASANFSTILCITSWLSMGLNQHIKSQKWQCWLRRLPNQNTKTSAYYTPTHTKKNARASLSTVREKIFLEG